MYAFLWYVAFTNRSFFGPKAQASILAQVVARLSQSAAPMADKKRKQPPDTDAYLHRAGNFGYQCKICSCVLFHGKDKARDHVVTHDATLQANLDEYRMPRVGPTVSCDQCDKKFRDTPAGRAELHKHQQLCGDTETICNRCGDDFKKPQWLRSHMAQNLRCAQRKEAHERYCMGCEDRPA